MILSSSSIIDDSLFIDLGNYPIIRYNPNGTTSGDYPTFYDVGPNSTTPWSTWKTNLKIDNRCSIVGHVSYANQLLLIIVGRFQWDRNGGSPIEDEKDRTIFLLVDFDILLAKPESILTISWEDVYGIFIDKGIDPTKEMIEDAFVFAVQNSGNECMMDSFSENIKFAVEWELEKSE